MTSLPADASRRRIGYVVKVFPRTSETFVLNEMCALERMGEELRFFPLHHGKDDIRHGMLAELRAPISFVEDSLPGEEETAHAKRTLAKAFGVSPELRARLLPRKYVRLAASLAAALRVQQVDHVHAHFASRSGHVAALAAMLAGCGFSMTAHAKDIYHRDVDRELLRWKIAAARFVITVTEFNRTYLRSLVRDDPHTADKIVRLYNGVDLARFHPSHQPSDPPMLLAVGRLVEKKGFPVLLDACARLRAAGRRFRCVIVGDGEQRDELRTRIAIAGLEDMVEMTGALASEQVATLLRSASLSVLPCVVGEDGNVDALPTVLLEAMAAGVAVISTRVSGVPEIVDDGVTGLLVEPNDAAGLGEAIARLLADPAGSARMGAAGRRRAEQHFDLTRNVSALRDLLHQARTGAPR